MSDIGRILVRFRKGDRLMLVIHLVVSFGAKKWNAPTSIHEMLSTDDAHLLMNLYPTPLRVRRRNYERTREAYLTGVIHCRQRVPA